MSKPREWKLLNCDLDAKDLGPVQSDQVTRVREISEAQDAAVEGMREALQKFGAIPMRGEYKDAELKCHMRLFHALEAYDLAFGKGE